MSISKDPDELLIAVASFAPAGNVRVAMVQILEFLADWDTETDPTIEVGLVKEILARGLVQLGFDIVAPEDCQNPDHDHSQDNARPYESYAELDLDDIISEFRRQLGTDDDKNGETK